jgi:dienelactone hydrolase
MPILRTVGHIAALLLAVVFISGCNPPAKPAHVDDLANLSIDALRVRAYGGSEITVEHQLDDQSQIASYYSDGLRVYARIDIPATPVPVKGYPVVVFVHGWMGREAAPTTDFYMDANSNYDKMINAYVNAGFVVITPGWRGHGTVNGVPADGIEFMEAWDNSTYLSPVFYAIDVLNLLDSLQSFDTARLDPGDINMVSHSQGGDVALIALAVAGEGSSVKNEWSAASFWSGCFPSRDTQFRTFSPMERTPEAFLSGDGSWNGTPIGTDGEVNANFVFGYPPDWIGTPHPEEWTWQKDAWATATVAEVLELRLQQMYKAMNTKVTNIRNASYELRTNPDGSTSIVHDPRIATALSQIDAFDRPELLTEPVSLQHSDRDFYSLPEWNVDLCERINSTGGDCHNFEYAGNTHSLGVSEHRWFSDADAVAGFAVALERDIALFRGENPSTVQ